LIAPLNDVPNQINAAAITKGATIHIYRGPPPSSLPHCVCPDIDTDGVTVRVGMSYRYETYQVSIVGIVWQAPPGKKGKKAAGKAVLYYVRHLTGANAGRYGPIMPMMFDSFIKKSHFIGCIPLDVWTMQCVGWHSIINEKEKRIHYPKPTVTPSIGITIGSLSLSLPIYLYISFLHLLCRSCHDCLGAKRTRSSATSSVPSTPTKIARKHVDESDDEESDSDSSSSSSSPVAARKFSPKKDSPTVINKLKKAQLELQQRFAKEKEEWKKEKKQMEDKCNPIHNVLNSFR